MLKLLCMCKLVLFMVTLSYIGYWKIIIFTGASEGSLKSDEKLQYINGSLFKPQLCSTTLNYCLFFESIGDQVYLVVFDNNTKTVAWIANRDDPIANFTSNAALTLDYSGVLQITRDSGKPIPVYPPPSSLPPPLLIFNQTFIATLQDSGNFVLQQHDITDGSKITLWQSFDHPTDVLLPGMKLGGDRNGGRMWSIVSYSHPDAPGSGPFSLEWDPYKKQLNILRNGKIYWASGELINNYTFEHIPEKMYEYLIDDESIIFNARNDQKHAPWRLTSEGVLLDSDGKVVAKTNECRGYNDDKGCQKWDVAITCRNQTFEFDVINATVKFFNASATDSIVNFTTSDCKDACWRNCDCVGFTALFDNGTGCYFVYKTLDNIQPGSDIFYRLNIKTNSSHPKTSPDPKGNTKQHSRWKLIIGFIIVAISILCGCGCLLCIVRKRKKFALKVKEKGITTEHTIHHLNSYGFDDPNDSRDSTKHDRYLRLFSYASIMEATNGFSSLNELGKGGFGPVYKGILMGKEVAIKRLSRSSGQGVVEFKNELMLESKLQHINLVQLLGCCIHEDERLLIYEYMPNKSLDFFLFDSTQSKLLDWKNRVNIIEGIAQGLLYLHKYSRLQIVHRDLKASNILLDKYMNPKISDFGLARIFMQESQEKTTRIVGTIGYMPPEYIINGVFSKKSDVYSFGVLTLEIVSGRRNNSFHNAPNPINLVGHAWELWKGDQALKLLDPTLHDLVVQDEALRYIHVGLLCVEECSVDRPTMLEVSSMLSNANEKLPLHRKPAFYFSDEKFEENEHPKIDSTNCMSISDFSAR